ncbi:hypothetical protein, partial [Bradyrhizobium sp. STM 3809]|uniref:hypothetical protein n=1 Tax=Bradyrhizobium sp. STM 3809 TaxID=551936 RepID=UPI001AEC2DCF
MPQLPLEPRLKNLTGSNDRARRKVIEHNAMARRVVEYLHRRILENPEPCQQYMWVEVARQLSLSIEE